MGFLDAIGRTNTAFGVGQSLLGGVQDYARFQTGLQQERFRNQLLTAESERRNKILDMQISEVQQREEADKKPFNVNLSPLLTAYAEDDPKREDLKRQLMGLSGSDQFGNTTSGNYQRALSIFAADKEAMTQIITAKKQQLYEAYGKKSEEIAKAKLTGDAEKLQKLTVEHQALQDKIIAAEGKMAEYLKMHDKQDSFGEKASDFREVTLAQDPSGKQLPEGKGYRYQVVPDPSSPTKFKLVPIGPAMDTRTATNIVLGQDQSGNVVTVPSRGEPIPKKTSLGLKPGEELQPKVAPTLPAEQAVQLQKFGTLDEALAQVKDLYDESFVGPIAGPIGAAQDKWGILPSAKRSEFRSLISNIQNSLLYLRSGAQINESELKRLLKELPTMDVSPTAFLAQIKKFTWELDSIKRGRLRQLKGAGYRNIPGGETPAPAPKGNRFEIIEVK